MQERRGGRMGAAAAASLTAVSIFAASALVLASLGVLAAINTDPPPAKPPVMTSQVREGVVTTTVSGEAMFVPRSRTQVSTPALPGGALAVVTADGLAVGADVKAGSVLAQVAARPVIALLGSFPMYRALGTGSSGADVTQLQKAMQAVGYKITDNPGEFRRSTARAVIQLYKDRELVALNSGNTPAKVSDDVSIPLGEIAFLPSLPGAVTTACGRTGQKVEAILCAVSSNASQLVVATDTASGEQISSGMKATVTTASGEELEGAVSNEVDAAAWTETPSEDDTRRYFEISLTEPADGEARSQGTVVIATDQSADKSLIVDVNMIHESDGRFSVQKQSRDKEDADTVEVSLLLCSASECAITPGGEIQVGDTLRANG
jgi:hypothetical protein